MLAWSTQEVLWFRAAQIMGQAAAIDRFYSYAKVCFPTSRSTGLEPILPVGPAAALLQTGT